MHLCSWTAGRETTDCGHADADFKLSDTSIQISNGETIGIRSIRQATLTGGPSDNAFDVSAGPARQRLTAAADSIKLCQRLTPTPCYRTQA